MNIQDILVMEAAEGILLINPFNAEMMAVDRVDISKVISMLKKDEYNKTFEYFLKPLTEEEVVRTSICSGSGIGIIPTLKCNFACEYCFEKNFEKNEMPVDMISKISKFVDQWNQEFQSHMVCEEIGLMGGEVLTEDSRILMEKVFQEFGEVKYKITTNGAGIILYRDLIKKYRPKMVVSLDGTEHMQMSRRKSKIENVYQKIIDGIKFLIKEEIETDINVVFNASFENEEYKIFLDQLESYGWLKEPNFNVVVSVEMDYGIRGCENHKLLRTLEKYRKLLHEDERAKYLYRDIIPGASRLERILKYKREQGKVYTSYCGANRGEGLVFAPDGYVYNCNLVMSERNRIGQCYPDTKIYREKVEEYQKREADSITECRECKMKLFCGGGCPASAITENGTIQSGFCGIWKDEEVLKNLDMVINVEALYKIARKYEK